MSEQNRPTTRAGRELTRTQRAQADAALDPIRVRLGAGETSITAEARQLGISVDELKRRLYAR